MSVQVKVEAIAVQIFVDRGPEVGGVGWLEVKALSDAFACIRTPWPLSGPGVITLLYNAA
jgi:hypothetical protein